MASTKAVISVLFLLVTSSLRSIDNFSQFKPYNCSAISTVSTFKQ